MRWFIVCAVLALGWLATPSRADDGLAERVKALEAQLARQDARLAEFGQRLTSVEKALAEVPRPEPSVGERPKDALSGSKGKIALAQMLNIAQAIDMYRMENKKLPDALEDLTRGTERQPEPYLNGLPKDPWGKPYEYRRDGNKRFGLRSWGPDGQPDTADDLSYPEEQR